MAMIRREIERARRAVHEEWPLLGMIITVAAIVGLLVGMVR